MAYTKEKLADIYLDWFNNFLTVEKFASYYGVSFCKAKQLIVLGRKYHNERIGV